MIIMQTALELEKQYAFSVLLQKHDGAQWLYFYQASRGAIDALILEGNKYGCYSQRLGINVEILIDRACRNFINDIAKDGTPFSLCAKKAKAILDSIPEISNELPSEEAPRPKF
jgi:hypothetical protein